MITVGHRSDLAYVFFCTSADSLPVTVSGGQIPIGSDLYITDSNQQFKWTGSAWYNFAEIVEETPVYNPLILSLSDLIAQNNAVLRQLLAAQQYSNILLSSSTSGSPDDPDTVQSTLMQ